MTLKSKNAWLADCRQYIAEDDRWCLESWQQELADWLSQAGQAAYAQKVRRVQLIFQEDTDLDWAHARQTEGLMYIEKILEVAEDPHARIFLSHCGADKERVRDYYRTLKEIGYQPWLDEEAMAAGTPLQRGLLEGMKASMAAVFFITDAFKDEGYLRRRSITRSTRRQHAARTSR
jgi:TIR domain-containing protein